MWRGGTHRRQGSPKDGSGGSQLVTVAIDGDKNSQHALKWAADHLISRGQIFNLLHVRRKVTSISTPTGHQLPISEVERKVASAFLEQNDLQTKELLLPFQCFCSRRGLQCKEVILDDMDIPKAIVDFVMYQSVDKLVLGSSSRNALTRTFKPVDVPTSVSRIAPEFCSVYVISKGKISSIRPAPRPNKYPINRPIRELEIAGNAFQSTKSEPDARNHTEAAGRYSLVRSTRVGYGSGGGLSGRSNDNATSASQPEVHLDFSYQSISSCPSPSRTSFDRPSNFYPRAFPDGGGRQSRLSNMHNPYSNEHMKNFESNESGGVYWPNESRSSVYEHSPSVSMEEGGASWSNHSMEDVQYRMRRLKFELKQTMDMYDDAYRETYGAKQQAPKWETDGKLGMEEASFSGETAIEMEEKKKLESKALLKAAQAAQKKMEVEASKRMNGERNLLQEMVEKRRVLDGFSSDIRYRKYTIEQIQEATDNFSDALKIGEGGYGPVFKSTLDHTLVAIKILRPDAAQGMKQFQQEVEVLSSIRHPNMVLLMGACPDYGCLVYEYMANGSLEDCLFCRSNTPPLSWQLRFKIAAEVATGLLFLHQTKPEPLVHRDLKPGNILLDHNFVSKIADVGLARLVPPSAADSVTQYRMTAAAGTFCYIDPEYQKTGMLGIKSDIYALGIILLQLITAAPPMGLAHNIESAIEMGKLEEILDPKVPDWPMEDTVKFAKLALKCAELQRKDRPDLASVVLPELNRMRAFAYPAQASQRVYHRPPKINYKESISAPCKVVSDFVDDGKVRCNSIT